MRMRHGCWIVTQGHWSVRGPMLQIDAAMPVFRQGGQEWDELGRVIGGGANHPDTAFNVHPTENDARAMVINLHISEIKRDKPPAPIPPAGRATAYDWPATEAQPQHKEGGE